MFAQQGGGAHRPSPSLSMPPPFAPPPPFRAHVQAPSLSMPAHHQPFPHPQMQHVAAMLAQQQQQNGQQQAQMAYVAQLQQQQRMLAQQHAATIRHPNTPSPHFPGHSQRMQSVSSSWATVRPTGPMMANHHIPHPAMPRQASMPTYTGPRSAFGSSSPLQGRLLDHSAASSQPGSAVASPQLLPRTGPPNKIPALPMPQGNPVLSLSPPHNPTPIPSLSLTSNITPGVQVRSPTPTRLKKNIKVRLPVESDVETLVVPPTSDAPVPKKSAWSRNPVSLTKKLNEEYSVDWLALLEAGSKEVWPEAETGLLESIDIYLPGRDAWTDYRADLIDERLEAFGFGPTNDEDRTKTVEQRLAMYNTAHPQSPLPTPLLAHFAPPAPPPQPASAEFNRAAPIAPRGHSSTMSIAHSAPLGLHLNLHSPSLPSPSSGIPSAGFPKTPVDAGYFDTEPPTNSLKATAIEFKPKSLNITAQEFKPTWMAVAPPSPRLTHRLDLTPKLRGVVEEEEEEEDNFGAESLGRLAQRRVDEESDVLTDSGSDSENEEVEVEDDTGVSRRNVDRSERVRQSITNASGYEGSQDGTSSDGETEYSNPSEEEAARQRRLRTPEVGEHLRRDTFGSEKAPDPDHWLNGEEEDIISNPSDEEEDDRSGSSIQSESNDLSGDLSRRASTNFHSRPLPKLPSQSDSNHSSFDNPTKKQQHVHQRSTSSTAPEFIFGGLTEVGSRNSSFDSSAIAGGHNNAMSSTLGRAAGAALIRHSASSHHFSQESNPTFTFSLPGPKMPDTVFGQKTSSSPTTEMSPQLILGSGSKRQKLEQEVWLSGSEDTPRELTTPVERPGRDNMKTFKFPPSPPIMPLTLPIPTVPNVNIVSPPRSVIVERDGTKTPPRPVEMVVPAIPSVSLSPFHRSIVAPYQLIPTQPPQIGFPRPLSPMRAKDLFEVASRSGNGDRPKSILPNFILQPPPIRPIAIHPNGLPISKLSSIPTSTLSNVKVTSPRSRRGGSDSVRVSLDSAFCGHLDGEEFVDDLDLDLDDGVNGTRQVVNISGRSNAIPISHCEIVPAEISPSFPKSPVDGLFVGTSPRGSEHTEDAISEVQTHYDPRQVILVESQIAHILDLKLGPLKSELKSLHASKMDWDSMTRQDFVDTVGERLERSLEVWTQKMSTTSSGDFIGSIDFETLRDLISEGQRRTHAAVADAVRQGTAHFPTQILTDLSRNHHRGIQFSDEQQQSLASVVVESLKKEMDSVRSSPAMASSDTFKVNEVVDAVLEGVKGLIVPNDGFTETDVAGALLTPKTPSQFDIDDLTLKLSEAVKPHIYALIDLASDKKETAALIVSALGPHLERVSELVVSTSTVDYDEVARRTVMLLEPILAESSIPSSTTSDHSILFSGLTDSIASMIESIPKSSPSFDVEDFVTRVTSTLKTPDPVSFDPILSKLSQCQEETMRNFETMSTSLLEAVEKQNSILISHEEGLVTELQSSLVKARSDFGKVRAERASDKERFEDEKRRLVEELQRNVVALANLESEVVELKNGQRSEGEVLRLREEVVTLNSKLNTATIESGERTAKMQSLQAKESEWYELNLKQRQDIGELEVKIRLAEAEVKAAQRHVDLITTSYEKLQSQHATDCERLHKREASLMSQAINVQKEHSTALKTVSEDLEDALQAKYTLEGTVVTLEKRVHSQDDKIDNLQRAATAKQQTLANVTQKFAEVEKRAKEVDHLRMEVTQLGSEANRAGVLDIELANANNTIRSLEDRVEELQGEQRVVQEEVERIHEDVRQELEQAASKQSNTEHLLEVSRIENERLKNEVEELKTNRRVSNSKPFQVASTSHISGLALSQYSPRDAYPTPPHASSHFSRSATYHVAPQAQQPSKSTFLRSSRTISGRGSSDSLASGGTIRSFGYDKIETSSAVDGGMSLRNVLDIGNRPSPTPSRMSSVTRATIDDDGWWS